HQHALLPLPPLTQCEVARIALRRMEAGITQDNHALLTLPHEPLKGIIARGRAQPGLRWAGRAYTVAALARMIIVRVSGSDMPTDRANSLNQALETRGERSGLSG